MHWMLMPLRRYAEFSGRSRRMEYWMWKLGLFVIGIVITTVLMALFGAAFFASGPEQINGMLAGAILLWGVVALFYLAIFVPDLAVTVRRLHDTNRSGLWILAPVVPYLVAMVAMGTGVSSGVEEGAVAGGMVALLAAAVAVVLGLVLFVFMLLEGTPGPNRFGADPKAQERVAPAE